MDESDVNKLIDLAIKAKDKSYSPYSNFRVGAALNTINNLIFQGANIENISFTPTVCAERTAIFSAILQGEFQFSALVVASDDLAFTPPCGVCRQVLAEFVDPSFSLFLINSKSERKELSFADIFPMPFTPTKPIGKKK